MQAFELPGIIIAMNIFERLFHDHRFDEWATEHSLVAARVLNQAAADLILHTEDDLATARWKDGLIDPNGFLIEKVAPRIRAVAEPLADMIIEAANQSLQTIVEDHVMWSRSVENAPNQGNAFESAGDIAAALVPFGAGAAAAIALPYAAVTTTTAYLGLVTTTAVSWPVVLGGGALAGLAIATGAVESSRIWSKAEARLRRKSRDFIVAALLKGSEQNPSILEKLTAEFRQTAERARAAS